MDNRYQREGRRHEPHPSRGLCGSRPDLGLSLNFAEDIVTLYRSSPSDERSLLTHLIALAFWLSFSAGCGGSPENTSGREAGSGDPKESRLASGSRPSGKGTSPNKEMKTRDSTTAVGPMVDEKSLLANREIILRGVINDRLANEVVAKLLYLHDRDKTAAITLHIVDSPGGSVTSGLAILDTIDFVRLPVRTCCTGTLGPLAVVIAAHGAKGVRSAESGAVLVLASAFAVDGVLSRAEEIAKDRRINYCRRS